MAKKLLHFARRSCRERLLWHNNKRRKRLSRAADGATATAPSAPRLTRRVLAASVAAANSVEVPSATACATAADDMAAVAAAQQLVASRRTAESGWDVPQRPLPDGAAFLPIPFLAQVIYGLSGSCNETSVACYDWIILLICSLVSKVVSLCIPLHLGAIITVAVFRSTRQLRSLPTVSVL